MNFARPSLIPIRIYKTISNSKFLIIYTGYPKFLIILSLKIGVYLSLLVVSVLSA